MNGTKTDIWMPVYIGDYLADTSHLTAEQHGAYLLLIFHLWRRGKLPTTDAALAQIARMPLPAWIAHRPVLEEFFIASKTGWTHKRVEQERAKVELRAQANRKRAQKAAAGRWGKHANDASSIDRPVLEESKSKSQSQSQSEAEVPTNTPPASQANTRSAAPEASAQQACVSAKRTGDERHVPFREALGKYWHEKNPASPELPWQRRDDRALQEFLKASPLLNETEFRRLLRNRARSAVAHGDRVYLWIGNLTRFQEEINAYNKPVSGGSGCASRAEINRDSVLNAVSKAMYMAEGDADGAGYAGAQPADFSQPRMPAAHGYGSGGRAVEMAGGSYPRLAARNSAYGEACGNGSFPYGATATVTSGIAAFGG